MTKRSVSMEQYKLRTQAYVDCQARLQSLVNVVSLLLAHAEESDQKGLYMVWEEDLGALSSKYDAIVKEHLG